MSSMKEWLKNLWSSDWKYVIIFCAVVMGLAIIGRSCKSCMREQEQKWNAYNCEIELDSLKAESLKKDSMITALQFENAALLKQANDYKIEIHRQIEDKRQLEDLNRRLAATLQKTVYKNNQ